MKKIGIIGYGFVGRAIANAHNEEQLLINDPKLFESIEIDVIKKETDWVYICVPTPVADDGSCDTSILESVLDSLEGYTGLVISKCTAIPRFYAEQHNAKHSFRLIHVPELLTAANANADYLKPFLIVIGGNVEDAVYYKDVVIQQDRTDTTETKFAATDIATASAFKYYVNSFLANKVIFNNEFARWCAAQGINWENVASVASIDPRIGTTHMSVPGPDGMYGYGGYCFPKDVSAILMSAKTIGLELTLMESQVKINNAIRK